MKTAKDVLKAIKDNDVKYVDLRFTDPRGKWQHVTFDQTVVDEDAMADGLMFDGSSISGWRAINESDMTLMPDPTSACMDPFFAASTMVINCDILDPATGQPYNRDPRGIAKKAEAYLKSTGVGDTAYFGPEAEFFVFDDVRYKADPYNTGFTLDAVELPSNGDTPYEGGNLGHRIRTKAGYFPVPPQDASQDMRGEMLAAMTQMGAVPEKHHHEVASAQHELGLKFGPLVTMADNMQIYKYCVHMVAQSYGKTATFMPKPVYGDNGSGMHVPSVDLEGRQAGDGGQQIRRPEPGMPATTSAASSSTPRRSTASPTPRPTATSVWFRASRRRCCSPIPCATARPPAAFRGPPTRRPSASRCASPIRSPTPISAFSAMLMAGLDGIQNKVDPGAAMDKDLYDLPPKELKKIPTVCGSLREALSNLDKDRAFLKAGGVFDDDFIDSYIELKMGEVAALRNDAAPGRIRHVLFELRRPRLGLGERAAVGPPFSFPR